MTVRILLKTHEGVKEARIIEQRVRAQNIDKGQQDNLTTNSQRPKLKSILIQKSEIS